MAQGSAGAALQATAEALQQATALQATAALPPGFRMLPPGPSSALAEGDDMVMVPRSLLKRMVDGVERASKAAGFAVTIASSARNGFEEERVRLADVASELREIANRGRIV